MIEQVNWKNHNNLFGLRAIVSNDERKESIYTISIQFCYPKLVSLW